MSGVNKVIIVGRLGNDPEMKYMPNGNAVTNVSIATSEKWKDKATGQPMEKTEWHRAVFFNKLAEVAGQYLKKGGMVYVEGSLATRKWQGQDGQDRYTTEIKALQMQMLDSRGDSSPSQGAPAPQQMAPQQQAPQQYAQPVTTNTAPMGQPMAPKAPPQGRLAPQPAQSFDNFDDDLPF